MIKLLSLNRLRHFLVFFLIGFGCSKFYSQNLISNGSFESYTNIDCNGGFLRSTFPYTIVVDNWNQYNTPDYFNPVCPSSGYSVPSNAIGNSNPKDGTAYGGFILFQANFETKEYIYQQLGNPLQSGHTYSLSFYVSRSDGITHAIHSIGAYFSNTLASGSSGYINVTPQILNQNGFLSDTTNWTEIKGTYTATGGEQYITIGNFNSNANTDTLFVGSNNPTPGAYKYAYYYIDNVSLYDQISVGISDYGEDDSFEIYPNPTEKTLNFKCKTVKENEFTIKLFDMFGKQLLNDYNKSELDVSDLESGIYFLSFYQNNTLVKTKKFIKK